LRAFGAAGGSRRHRRLGIALSMLLLCGLVAGGVLIWREVAPQLAVSGLPPAGAGAEDVVPMTSNSFRIKTWVAALEAARERPILGYGLGTFYEAYSPFKLGAHTAYAHNVVIQQLVEVGAIGALLLVAFLAVAIFRPIKTLFGRMAKPQIPLLLGALAFVLHNLVDLTWYFPALLFVFMLVLGLMSSYASSSPPPETEPPAASPKS
jgi:O-antigen ligase